MRGLGESSQRMPTYEAEWPPGAWWPLPRVPRSGLRGSGWQLSFGEWQAHLEVVRSTHELAHQLQSGRSRSAVSRSESASAAASALALAAAFSVHRISEGGPSHHDYE